MDVAEKVKEEVRREVWQEKIVEEVQDDVEEVVGCCQKAGKDYGLADGCAMEKKHKAS